MRDLVYPRRMYQGRARVIFGGALVVACSSSAPVAKDTGGPSPTPVTTAVPVTPPTPEAPTKEAPKTEPQAPPDGEAKPVRPAGAPGGDNFMFVFRDDVVVEP